MENNQLRIQNLLSFGYIYLLILGIIRDSIYFGLMGVNIIHYSSVTDILFSPLAYLVDEPYLTLFFVIATYFAVIQPQFHRKHKDKAWYQRIFDAEKREERFAKPTMVHGELIMLAFAISSMLLGTGVGRGLGMSKKMRNQEFKHNDRLEFVDGESQEVAIIGQNSLYLFYVMQGQTHVSISPFNGAVKRLQLNAIETEKAK
ncbi:MAG: hypothetical protein KTR30_02505 [Saprospiraceae bacterium]|nr:hypothetical protein [Saprospiraceae bacterium]